MEREGVERGGGEIKQKVDIRTVTDFHLSFYENLTCHPLPLSRV